MPDGAKTNNKERVRQAVRAKVGGIRARQGEVVGRFGLDIWAIIEDLCDGVEMLVDHAEEQDTAKAPENATIDRAKLPVK